eukprot:scaffold5517_cov135-Cylindrotheca_fusiformis.AAC.30
MSKSFGSTLMVTKSSIDRHNTTDLLNVSYSGYLLKRSNQPRLPESSLVPALNPLDAPGLPMMPGILHPDRLEISEHSRTVAPLITPSPPPPAPPRDMEKSSIELGLESAAAFFGMPLERTKRVEQTSQQPFRNSEEQNQGDRTPSIPIASSASIRVDNTAHQQEIPPKRLFSRPQTSFVYNRQHSAPDLSTEKTQNDNQVMENDFRDCDGYLWRSKYCVLEEGVLYFYRSTSDAESADAVHERRLDSRRNESCGWKTTTSSSSMDLSKSPMARGSYLHTDSVASDEYNCLWEKRVFLNSVGSVRSAEKEFGSHAFQLEAVSVDDEHDDIDSLVLRAQNQEDMKEWIFQFHRSLSLIMRNIMKDETYLDSPHSARSHRPTSFLHSSPSEKELPRMLGMSPKFAITPTLPNPLSHGHGRITQHRRRHDTRKSAASDNGTSSLSSTPETNGSNSPPEQSSFCCGTSPTSNAFSMSPIEVSSPDRLLFPPASQKPEVEVNAGTSEKHVPPVLRKEKKLQVRAKGAKYVPPALRKKPGDDLNSQTVTEDRNSWQFSSAEPPLTLAQRAQQSDLGVNIDTSFNTFASSGEFDRNRHLDVVGPQILPFQRGGCADPQVVEGSIMDPAFIPRKASRLDPTSTQPFGCFGGGDVEGGLGCKSSLRWEIGAVSECGVRNSNEDAYLISNDLLNALQSLSSPGDSSDSPKPWNLSGVDHKVGLFAVFDGHCGDQAARFAAEQLEHFIFQEIRSKLEHENMVCGGASIDPNSRQLLLDAPQVELILQEALIKMDDSFCHLCQEGGRDWESGATALIAVIANEHLVIANLGDCRGVLCRSVSDEISYVEDAFWNELDTVVDDHCRRTNESADGESNRCFWKEMTNIHSPASERERIEEANGWVTTETEIPIGQLRRMDFLDEDVVGILKRCFHERNDNSEKSSRECKAAPQRILEISRICGELAVSRALGDRDFKAAFNSPSPISQVGEGKTGCWDCPLFLPYPDVHDRCFRGDLVSNMPDFQRIRIGEEGISEEFLLLACDGLWDVLDADDAVRVTRDLLFRKKFTAKRAVRRCCSLQRISSNILIDFSVVASKAARIAELAIHLGSSDNVTVVVVRLFSRNESGAETASRIAMELD